jgi:hypothetical protein
MMINDDDKTVSQFLFFSPCNLINYSVFLFFSFFYFFMSDRPEDQDVRARGVRRRAYEMSSKARLQAQLFF